jgi:hypothetical protein
MAALGTDQTCSAQGVATSLPIQLGVLEGKRPGEDKGEL